MFACDLARTPSIHPFKFKQHISIIFYSFPPAYCLFRHLYSSSSDKVYIFECLSIFFLFSLSFFLLFLCSRGDQAIKQPTNQTTNEPAKQTHNQFQNILYQNIKYYNHIQNDREMNNTTEREILRDSNFKVTK